MSFDVKKRIKTNAIAFGIYSAIAMIVLYWTISVPDSYVGVVVMISYACLLGIHALITFFEFIIFSKNKEARLKGILVILAIGIIGFGLCMSPVIFY